MKKRILIALFIATVAGCAWGGFSGYLNGTQPPPAWPLSLALISWPTGSWVTLYVPVAAVYVVCLFAAMRRRAGS